MRTRTSAVRKTYRAAHRPPRVRPRPQAGDRGKRTAPPRRTGAKLRLFRLVASGLIFALVVAAKFALPQQTAQWGGKLLEAMGRETDFVAAFSAAGRAVGGEKWGKSVEELCAAVFGSEEVAVSAAVDRTDVLYAQETTPQRVEMLQQVLGFAYAAPVEGTLSSSFGYRDHPTANAERFHYGIDLSAQEGTVIRAFADGTVTVVGQSSEYGHYVEVAHANGYTTLYAHCSRITASSGQSVKLGDPIAEVGDSGDATGCHLHFELVHRGTYLNPVYYVA